MNEADLERFRQLLAARRTELEGYAELNPDAAQTVELDQARVGRLSRMDALQGQAMAQAAEQRRKQELLRIEAACSRIDSGDYGDCLKCDESISTDRLEISPTATLCIACATKAESK